MKFSQRLYFSIYQVLVPFCPAIWWSNHPFRFLVVQLRLFCVVGFPLGKRVTLMSWQGGVKTPSQSDDVLEPVVFFSFDSVASEKSLTQHPELIRFPSAQLDKWLLVICWALITWATNGVKALI